MKAFHDDPALRLHVQRRLTHSRENRLFVQGAAWTDDDPQNGCAVILTLGYRTAMYRAYCDYQTVLGLPHLLAQIEELVFDALPPDLACEFPERVVDAIAVGVDLTTLHWKLMRTTLLAHEGAADLRIVDMVRECAGHLQFLADGGVVDVDEANELGLKAHKCLYRVADAVGLRPHPAWEAADLARHASLAIGTHQFTHTDKELMLGFLKCTRAQHEAIAMSDRLIECLRACARGASRPTRLRPRMRSSSTHSEAAPGTSVVIRFTPRTMHGTSRSID